MTPREQMLAARAHADSTAGGPDDRPSAPPPVAGCDEFVRYGRLDPVKFGDSEGAEHLLDAIEERVLELRRVEEQIRRRSHAHRCTCACACQESVECFVLPHRNEDGPYCPDEALTFICAACRQADLCEYCGAHPRPGETFVRHDGDLMCVTCLAVTEEHEEDAAALVIAEFTRSRLRSGLVVSDAPSHVLTLRPGMPAGYAECLRCARSIALADIGEPCRGDIDGQSGGALPPGAAEPPARAPRFV